MSAGGIDAREELQTRSGSVIYHSLAKAEQSGVGNLTALPFSLKVLAENLLRHQARASIDEAQIRALAAWPRDPRAGREVSYHPARIIMPEISGLPLLNDLCAMREAMAAAGGDPAAINPSIPIDLIVDHSVMADVAGQAGALEANMAFEMQRNEERFQFLKWAEKSFQRIRLVPPGNGILHQVNIEYLATVVATEASDEQGGAMTAYVDCLVGMDSHTPMINALGIMGWGVGGIEAGAAMLGQPISLRIPEVVGCRLTGELRPEVTATDLVLTLTQQLRELGVVQKFVEFCGSGLDGLSLTDRATLSNMAPEYGATMGFVPVDARTVQYLRATGRSEQHADLVEQYCKAQGLWRDSAVPEPRFSTDLEIDLAAVEPSMAGPFRPNQRVSLSQVPASFATASEERGWSKGGAGSVNARSQALDDGVVALAAITSCTNTSNPAVMLGAGLLARKARERGLQAKPWVKTVLAPGSRVVADYLAEAGLQKSLDELGFQVTGFGCTVCMGNSGALQPEVAAAVDTAQLVAAAVLSGNRNFEGRVHAQCKTAYLASPPLVVAYAIAGSVNIDLDNEPLGEDSAGAAVYLRDIWPVREEIESLSRQVLSPDLFAARYESGENFQIGEPAWQALSSTGGVRFDWDPASDYLVCPPYFEGFQASSVEVAPIESARPLLMVGDNITTDHISPVGVIEPDGPAGIYLQGVGVQVEDFNGFAARRANHEVMIRGTFSSPRLHNELVPDAAEGGYTRIQPDGDVVPVFEASAHYRRSGVPLVVVGGKEYGTGSSRDWAAKGTYLLGVRAVIAESIERIHRSNLVGMGVLPAQFPAGVTRESLDLDGTETYTIGGIGKRMEAGAKLPLRIARRDGRTTEIEIISRLDTPTEVAYFLNGGMLHYVLRQALCAA